MDFLGDNCLLNILLELLLLLLLNVDTLFYWDYNIFWSEMSWFNKNDLPVLYIPITETIFKGPLENLSVIT